MWHACTAQGQQEAVVAERSELATPASAVPTGVWCCHPALSFYTIVVMRCSDQLFPAQL